MRFVADGPSIPDDLLIARDEGDVIFFCGAGVSRHEAGLPDFEGLGDRVIEILGASRNSPARSLLKKASETARVPGVGGLVATDRIFGLLEREFEVTDVRAAIAEAISPSPDRRLGAHRTILDLARSKNGVTRLVTTNFDLLFEECDPSLDSFGPPKLPDPKSDPEFRGIVHLHGLVDSNYQNAVGDEFVVSSADFGRAYLSDGWATRFIQSLLSRFYIVFVGYTADDPPVQYLLEALNLRAGNKSRLFAFQEGESAAATALWEHRGVQALPFDSRQGFGPLWETLHGWAARARDVDAWYTDRLSSAIVGPAKLPPHVRGQIAHIASSEEGARRIVAAEEPLPASWLLVLDPSQRYADSGLFDVYAKDGTWFDPFELLYLDEDQFPEPLDPENRPSRRKIPLQARDILSSSRLDFEGVRNDVAGVLRGQTGPAALPPRLNKVGAWLCRIAHQPIALWWAAHQSNLHPTVRQQIKSALLHDPKRFPEPIRRGWHNLIAAWEDERANPDHHGFEIGIRVGLSGWTPTLVREFAGLHRPQKKVNQGFGIPHPLLWMEGAPERIIRVDVEYPRPHQVLCVSDEMLRFAVTNFRQNLELAIALEFEITGSHYLHFDTTWADGGFEPSEAGAYGIASLILTFQKLMGQLVEVDIASARAEIAAWPTDDDYVFAGLRIWSCGLPNLLSPSEAANVFLALSEFAFWSDLHERYILYGLRQRWKQFSARSRKAIENWLLHDQPPPGNVSDSRYADAYSKLSRLHWLSRSGVVFSFNLETCINALRLLAPEWTEAAGDVVADSRAPQVRGIAIDVTPDPLLETPIAEILSSGGRN